MHLPVPYSDTAFTLFGMDVKWYAIMIVTGIILAVILGCKRAPKYGFDTDTILDLMLVVLPCAVIGARAYYVIFEWDRYADNWLEIFNFRGGGLAIHGGLIAAFLAAWLMCRKKGLNIVKGLDMAAPSIALGQAIGRWGNYFNQEAHGGPTDLPWGILIDGEYVHPTFLYESLWCFLLVVVLILIARKQKFDGQIILLYGILYSVERYFVEGLRTDSLWIGPFRQAQVLSVSLIIACTVVYIILEKRAAKAAAVAEAETLADEAIAADGSAEMSAADSESAAEEN
ncbi:MAG: prolipoprotein diacylglyceryl transferase [Clostridiales bacterium]|nr:prolipoprotein diacylglyceryl transferase [Clostridiales bacterium]